MPNWWVGHLKFNENSLKYDKETFSSWEEGTIDTETAIEEMRKNNMLNPTREIIPIDFEKWLNSLGYKKGA